MAKTQKTQTELPDGFQKAFKTGNGWLMVGVGMYQGKQTLNIREGFDPDGDLHRLQPTKRGLSIPMELSGKVLETAGYISGQIYASVGQSLGGLGSLRCKLFILLKGRILCKAGINGLFCCS